MKLWVDDERRMPENYNEVARSVNEAKELIEANKDNIEVIDLDYYAGYQKENGGHFVELLKWFEKTGQNYPIKLHSSDPFGNKEMLDICHRNGWIVLNEKI